MSFFSVEIVTPDSAETLADIEFLMVPAATGALTVLAGHEPMVCLLRNGILAMRRQEGEKISYSVRAGVLSVVDNKVSILTRSSRAIRIGTGTEQ